MKISLIILPLFVIATNCFSQIPSYIPSNGLLAWYPFDGNANDESSSGNDGTVNGALLTSDRLGNPNSAFMFDGVDDHIYISVLNGIAPTSSHTVSFWVNKDANGCDNEMVVATFDNPPTDNNNLHYGFKPCDVDCETKMCMGMDFYANSLVAVNELDTSWVCWSLVYDSASLQRSIYLSGNLVAQEHASASYEGTLDMVIGSTSWQGLPMGAFFTGKIDDVGIWKRALTLQEVSELCGEGMAVGLSEVSSDMTFHIYPNPSNGFVSIASNQNLKNCTLNVYDGYGKVVYKTLLVDKNREKTIDLSWLSNGVYSVTLNAQNYIGVKKLIIQ